MRGCYYDSGGLRYARCGRSSPEKSSSNESRTAFEGIGAHHLSQRGRSGPPPFMTTTRPSRPHQKRRSRRLWPTLKATLRPLNEATARVVAAVAAWRCYQWRPNLFSGKAGTTSRNVRRISISSASAPVQKACGNLIDDWPRPWAPGRRIPRRTASGGTSGPSPSPRARRRKTPSCGAGTR